eukprot:SAG11_NODE_353_length_10348_cov_6.938335_11_plen_152_part_00
MAQNLGCPQNIAKKGHYGAYLLPEVDRLVGIVEMLVAGGCGAVTAKIRMLPTVGETVAVARALVKAGCVMLTVHGRTKEQRGQATGCCSWAAVRAVREAVPNIPGEPALARCCRCCCAAPVVHHFPGYLGLISPLITRRRSDREWWRGERR